MTSVWGEGQSYSGSIVVETTEVGRENQGVSGSIGVVMAGVLFWQGVGEKGRVTGGALEWKWRGCSYGSDWEIGAGLQVEQWDGNGRDVVVAGSGNEGRVTGGTLGSVMAEKKFKHIRRP